MKHKAMRITIFVLVVFGALTTLAGGIGLLTGAIAAPLNWLEGSPFVDYTIPGLALAIIVGGSMLFAAATIFTGREIGTRVRLCRARHDDLRDRRGPSH